MNLIKKIEEFSTEKAKNTLEFEYILLLNRYLILLSLLYFFHAIFEFVFIDLTTAIITFAFSILIFSILFSKNKTNKIAITTFEIVMSIIINISTSIYGYKSGVILYYIPLLLSFPFVFNLKKDKKYMIIVMAFIVLEFIISFFTNNSLFTNTTIDDTIRKKILILVSIDFAVLLFLNMFFINKKNALLISYDTIDKKVSSKLNSMLSRDNISNENLIELFTLSINNYSAFYVKFKELYPIFYKNLNENYPDLVSSELELLAYLKLNFSTNEIASYTKSSVRSIESKKYRIRKKIGISSDVDISEWLQNFS